MCPESAGGLYIETLVIPTSLPLRASLHFSTAVLMSVKNVIPEVRPPLCVPAAGSACAGLGAAGLRHSLPALPDSSWCWQPGCGVACLSLVRRVYLPCTWGTDGLGKRDPAQFLAAQNASQCFMSGDMFYSPAHAFRWTAGSTESYNQNPIYHLLQNPTLPFYSNLTLSFLTNMCAQPAASHPAQSQGIECAFWRKAAVPEWGTGPDDSPAKDCQGEMVGA